MILELFLIFGQSTKMVSYRKKGPDYFFKGVIMPKMSSQWLVCPLIARIVWEKKALTNFWIIILLLIVISSILIQLELLFGCPDPFWAKIRPKIRFLTKK